MKKLSLIITSLTTAVLLSLTACGQTPEEETADLCKDIQKLLPRSTADFRLGKVAPNVDKLGINVEFNLISRQITAESIQPKQLDPTFTTSFQALFCKGKTLRSQLNKFTSDGHYINFAINDYKKQNVSNIKVDTNFCSKNELKENSLDLASKQVKQGFYDEEYLSSMLVPATKKIFPVAYDDELTMVDLKAGPGSQLHYIVVYKPKKEVTAPEAEAKAKDFLNQIVDSVCNDSSFKNLSKNVDLITYHFTLDGKDVLTKSIKKGCKLN